MNNNEEQNKQYIREALDLPGVLCNIIGDYSRCDRVERRARRRLGRCLKRIRRYGFEWCDGEEDNSDYEEHQALPVKYVRMCEEERKYEKQRRRR